ncbi:MAG: TetR/AcrR family transcriptional regulator, partial [Myxococcota bacterium]
TKAGHFAAVGNATVAARVIVETVAWFAWHRGDDPDPDLLPDDDTVRAEVLRRIVASFVPE